MKEEIKKISFWNKLGALEKEELQFFLFAYEKSLLEKKKTFDEIFDDFYQKVFTEFVSKNNL